MTKKKSGIVVVIVLGMMIICGTLLVVAPRYGHLSITLPVEHKTQFVNENIALFPTRLRVYGNQIVKEGGQVVIPNGVFRMKARMHRHPFWLETLPHMASRF